MEELSLIVGTIQLAEGRERRVVDLRGSLKQLGDRQRGGTYSDCFCCRRV